MSKDCFWVILLCQDYQFHVQRELVIRESPVIAAALKHPFKGHVFICEGDYSGIPIEVYQPMQPSTYKVLFKGEVIRAAQATHQTQGAKLASAGGSQQNAQPQPITEPEEKPVPTYTDVMFYYAHLNGIADYYGVRRLAETTVDRLYSLFRLVWSTDDFWLLVEELDNISGDIGLRRYLSNIDIWHVVDGLTDEDLEVVRSLFIWN
ncbi:hypothetical protein F5Y03DRAFT_406222 [Xylaria venustula]|nr:hypothetical protein F5Y03DRAFT_406222 [Xylaria venustula]